MGDVVLLGGDLPFDYFPVAQVLVTSMCIGTGQGAVSSSLLR